MALLAKQTQLFSTVHLVYPSNVLMNKDKEAFEELWRLSNL